MNVVQTCVCSHDFVSSEADISREFEVCGLTLIQALSSSCSLPGITKHSKMMKIVLLMLLPAVLLGQPGGQPGGTALNRAIDTLYKQIDVSDDNRAVLAEFDGYFLGFDRNGDDQLSHLEFYRSLHHASSGFSGHEGQLFGLFDQNDDANVTRTDIEESFRAADRDNNTRLTEIEFRQFIHSATVIVG